LAIGPMILIDLWNMPPFPGNFEYDWFGIDSTGDGWDYAYWFTWAIGAEPGYPDSMKIDVAKNGDQDDYACAVYSQRLGGDTLFIWGLWVDGNPPAPEYYQQPVGIIYRPNGTAISALMNFSLYFMPNLDVQQTMTNILRDEFGCTYYEDPPPLPPWRVEVVAIPGGDLWLTWDAIDENDIVYIYIERSENGGPYSTIAQLSPDNGDYIDTGLNPGLPYSYKLRCQDFAGQFGYYSNVVSDTGGRPQRPENPIAQSGNAQVTLTWEHPDDPTIVNYKIYRALGFNGDFNLLATLPSTNSSYIDFDVTNRYVYSYYLTSISNFGVESYPSDTVFAFPFAPGREGILVVNGIDWESYGGDVINLYQNNSFTGNYPYLFWDLFHSTPFNVIDPDIILGQGELPEMFFDAFQTIIWAGNAYSGDLEHWENNLDNIIDFLTSGGYMVLPTRYGGDFFSTELVYFAGIDSSTWDYCSSSSHLISTHPDITDIDRIGSQSFCEVVMTTGPYTTRLWKPSDANYDSYAAGFIAEPPGQGKFVYIAGRSYRWDNDDLRDNMEVILGLFFGMTGIDENETMLPEKFVLYQNYPNPFNPNTIIKFGLPVQSDVRLEIYDILGRSVKVLTDGELEAGYHEIIWDGKNRQGNDIASGVYFYRLKTESFSDIKKMLLLK